MVEVPETLHKLIKSQDLNSVRKGRLQFRPIEFYNEEGDNSARYDIDEGRLEVIDTDVNKLSPVQLRLGSQTIGDLHSLRWGICRNRLLVCSLSCSSLIKQSTLVREEGYDALVIYNEPLKLIQNLTLDLKRLGIILHHGYVKYSSKNTVQEWGGPESFLAQESVLVKGLNYQDQYEYRLFFDPAFLLQHADLQKSDRLLVEVANLEDSISIELI